MKKKNLRTPEEKKVVVEGFKADIPLEDYCKKHSINPNQFYLWRREMSGPKSRKTQIVGARGDNLLKLQTQNEVLKEMLADAYRKAA